MIASSQPPTAFPLVEEAAGLGWSALEAVLGAATAIGSYLADRLPAGDARLAGQAVWLVLVVVIGYWICFRVLRRPVPDLFRWLIRPANAAVSALGYVLQLSDFAVASLMTRMKRVPPIWYGQVIHDVTEAGHRGVSWFLTSLATFSARFPHALAAILICAALFDWNSDQCLPDQAFCEHPVERWADQVLGDSPAPALPPSTPVNPQQLLAG